MPPRPLARPDQNRMTRFLHVVEWLGNALPHPVTLFAMFAAGVVVLSGILGYFEVAVVDPRPEGAKGRADNGMIEVVSLLNADGLRMIVLNLVRNFVEFAPLGTVLVALLGVGVAERSGWLTALIRGMVLNAPPSLVTVIIVFSGIFLQHRLGNGLRGSGAAGCRRVLFIGAASACRARGRIRGSIGGL